MRPTHLNLERVCATRPSKWQSSAPRSRVSDCILCHDVALIDHDHHVRCRSAYSNPCVAVRCVASSCELRLNGMHTRTRTRGPAESFRHQKIGYFSLGWSSTLDHTDRQIQDLFIFSVSFWSPASHRPMKHAEERSTRICDSYQEATVLIRPEKRRRDGRSQGQKPRGVLFSSDTLVALLVAAVS